MLARTPARHARRCDATANTRVRLFPNVSVCGCVVRRGDDHRSGAERCVPARSVLGAFFNCRSGEASDQPTATSSEASVHLISRDEIFGPAGGFAHSSGRTPKRSPVSRHGEEVRL